MVEWSDEAIAQAQCNQHDDGSAANEPVHLPGAMTEWPYQHATVPRHEHDDIKRAVTQAAEQIGRLICERDQMQREIVEERKLQSQLMYEVMTLRALLSRLPDPEPSSSTETIDTSPEGVKAHIDRAIDHLHNQRVSPELRGDLRKATERAERLSNTQADALRRAIR